MIGFRACAGAVLLSLLFGGTLQADTVTQTLDAAHFGWYSRHDEGGSTYEYLYGLDNSYLAGRYTDSDDYMAEYRNFLVFDLSSLTGKSIVSATLKIDTLTIAGGTQTYDLYDVSTPVSDLISGGPNPNTIFGDLGSGTAYADCGILTPDTVLEIPLSAQFVTAANATRENFAIGGALTTLTPGSSDDQFAFGSVDRLTSPQLVLETIPIPEPGTFVLLFVGAVSLLAFPRKRQVRQP